MQLVNQILRPNDIMIFTVEESIGEIETEDGWSLQPSGRFTHSEKYIRDLIGEYASLRIDSLDRIVPRYENGEPISGMLLVVKKSV